MARGTVDRRAFLMGRLAPPPVEIIAVDDACFARRGIVCRTCADVCPEEAIRFTPRIGGPALPALSNERCVACEECIAACPAGAIRLAAPEERAPHV